MFELSCQQLKHLKDNNMCAKSCFQASMKTKSCFKAFLKGQPNVIQMDKTPITKEMNEPAEQSQPNV